MKKLGINVGFKVGIGCNFFVDSGHFELFLNCLTIYFILWLRDILGGVSKWLSKWFIELCGDFVQFWDD